MPTCAALMPVARQITPPMIMAIRIPLPACAAVAPNDTNRPVPKIIAAVRSVAVVFPRLRLLERADLDVVVEAVTVLPSQSHFWIGLRSATALCGSLLAPMPQECRPPSASVTSRKGFETIRPSSSVGEAPPGVPYFLLGCATPSPCALP